MSKLIQIFFLSLMVSSSVTYATYGVVVADDYKCKGDHMLIETAYGYTLAELYSGSLYEDTYLYGDLHSYSFTNVYESESDYEAERNDIGYVYIDDYMESKSKALEWCFEE